jgi:hypothetical protein
VHGIAVVPLSPSNCSGGNTSGVSTARRKQTRNERRVYTWLVRALILIEKAVARTAKRVALGSRFPPNGFRAIEGFLIKVTRRLLATKETG